MEYRIRFVDYTNRMDTAAAFPLVLATLGVLASGRVPAAQAVFDIQLHLQLDRSIAQRLPLAEFQDEVEQIWQPYGVRITWPDSRSAAEPFPLTAILDHQSERAGVQIGPLVLGKAIVESSYPPTRPIRVSFEATEQTLAQQQHAWRSVGHLHEHELARALGRVLAHEIGHVLLALRAHEQTGLMRETFTPEQLARADRSPFALTRNSLGRLQSRIERLRMQWAYMLHSGIFEHPS
jgi:hypothetical protein